MSKSALHPVSRDTVKCERCDETLDAESAGSVHDYMLGVRITVCDPCMDAEPGETEAAHG